MRDPGLPLPAPARARQPWSLRRQLLTGILVPVILFIGFNTWSLYHQTLAALNTAYDRTLLASAKSISRSEEHTSELQSQSNLVCRLLLEKKKKSRKERICIAFINDLL